MNLVTKLLAGLLLVASLLGAFLYQRNQTLWERLQAEQARVLIFEQTLASTQKSLDVYMTRAKATRERADKNQKEVSRALESNPAWRDLPVPDAVYDGLYHNRGRASDATSKPTR